MTRIAVAHAEDLDLVETTDAGTIPADVYRTQNYLVVNVALPHCRPEHVHLAVAPGGLRIETDEHPGEPAVEDERMFLVRELPHGHRRRTLAFDTDDLALDDAEAHFGNGLLSISIPTRERDAYRHRAREA